ncbi:MAG TPA: DUF4286 family protein [Puia sp.]|nr:DUF4286 family protein [Puia sp.]
MIVYNITCKVRWEIVGGWLAWQRDEHVPATLATGFFDESRLFRLLDQEEDEGPTFVIQFFTSSQERYQRFLLDCEPGLRRAAWEKWGSGYIAFRTLMESV